MKRLFFCCFLFISASFLFSQNIDIDEAKAQDEFKQGVMSYNSGYYNQAYIRFEKALSYKPYNQLYRFWLGNVNYRNGYSSVAVNLWKGLIKENYKSELLKNKIELIEQKYKIDDYGFFDYKFVNSNTVKNFQGKLRIFKNPISLVATDTGGFLLTSFTTDEISEFNVNAINTGKFFLQVAGIEKPFDIIESDDKNYFVSDFKNNRVVKINSAGFKILEFGSTGRGEGQFYGPQFLALDNRGYIFVSDVGNKMVSKFDLEGKFILRFGKPQINFDGFLLPTGVLVIDDNIYVADKRLKSIFVFDLSGNYIRTICKNRVASPEGLSLDIEKGNILISDTSRIMGYNLEKEKLSVLVDNKKLFKRVTKSIVDRNSNIIAVDEAGEKVDYYTNMNFLYTGFNADYQFIDALNFPEVVINITVKNQDGKPFVGLNKNNFVIYENGDRLKDFELLYNSNKDEQFSSVLLIDRDIDFKANRLACEYVISNLLNSTGRGDEINIISAYNIPINEGKIISPKFVPVDELKSFIRKAIPESKKYEQNRILDIPLREAITKILTKDRKKAVIYLTNGRINEKDDFSTFQVKRLVDYANINNVSFYYIIIGDGNRLDTKILDYLASKTNGKGIFHDNPLGVGQIIEDIKKSYSCEYTFKYKSKGRSDYGRNYFPSKIEIHHFNRTGSLESGFFAPSN